MVTIQTTPNFYLSQNFESVPVNFTSLKCRPLHVLIFEVGARSWTRLSPKKKEPFFCVEVARCIYDTVPFASILSLQQQIVGGCLRKKIHTSSPISIILPSYIGMRGTGQEVIFHLITVPAEYWGGHAFRHLSHVIYRLCHKSITSTLIEKDQVE